ncbi:MAG: hypothetical protein JRM74_02480 [Nitrososphaerota archaeon]|jgi:orotate phosphoribosyltransferase|nr:hypothetical protein [Nitrososphaerota archaeon]MDG6956257.1 hypothetical protein [Nitrososphaerota archaeon]MDG6968370.1 hypothetical protein [Nitrososphaerota archaeon]MDG6976166.1 hypothetical protein [Nitrososphaerota archaeon]MDG6982300.1 hypothetical protein [Nitrososphaerota archaeon]
MAWKRRSGRLGELAEGLVKAGALQFGTFTLPDGGYSSYYVDLRGLASYPGAYGMAVEALSELVSKKAPRADALCAVPVTGLLFASPMAVALGKPMVYTRLGKHENERLVEGEVRPGWNVVVVDEITTSGRTILAAADAVEDEGGKVTSAVVLVDRLEGAREKLSKRGITLHAATDILELADLLHSMELITDENMKAITQSVGKKQPPRRRS